MVGGIAVIGADIASIREHLARLNGKVAAHQEKLTAIELEHAKQEGASRLLARLAPALWVCVGVACMMILQNASAVLAAIRR